MASTAGFHWIVFGPLGVTHIYSRLVGNEDGAQPLVVWPEVLPPPTGNRTHNLAVTW